MEVLRLLSLEGEGGPLCTFAWHLSPHSLLSCTLRESGFLVSGRTYCTSRLLSSGATKWLIVRGEHSDSISSIPEALLSQPWTRGCPFNQEYSADSKNRLHARTREYLSDKSNEVPIRHSMQPADEHRRGTFSRLKCSRRARDNNKTGLALAGGSKYHYHGLVPEFILVKTKCGCVIQSHSPL